MSTTTHMIILVDVSYSMLNHISNFVIALNNYLNKLKKDRRYYRITIGQFNTNLSFITVFKELDTLGEYNIGQFNINGTTSLYDGIYDTIKYVSNNSIMKDMHTQMFIISDGEDNASFKCTKTDADKIMNHVINQYNWQIIHCHTDLSIFDTIQTVNYDINDICNIFVKLQV
jgi:uncharacterized protein YegL